MKNEEVLKTAIQDFQPAPNKSVTVWFHDNGNDEHYVGLATKVNIKESSLDIEFEWMVRVERDRDRQNWKPIGKSKLSGNHMTFTRPVIKSKLGDQVELKENKDIINLYLGTDRLTEAQRILERY